MTAHHAIDIALTRPATDDELCRARRVVALASDTSRTRLLVLQRARTPGRALRALRHRLDAMLPIDVLTTHYPDRHGRVLSEIITDAVARYGEERARHLASRLEELLVGHAPGELLLCAVSALHRRSRGKCASAPS